ncbi:MAG: hypothetical protein NTU84_09720 [Verrucomicrobia bacterium]|nr:hypothetical protein [Verrucomicrobiota bacterium]
MAALVDMQRGRTQLCIEGTRERIVLFGIMDRDLDVGCLVVIGAKARDATFRWILYFSKISEWINFDQTSSNRTGKCPIGN